MIAAWDKIPLHPAGRIWGRNTCLVLPGLKRRRRVGTWLESPLSSPRGIRTKSPSAATAASRRHRANRILSPETPRVRPVGREPQVEPPQVLWLCQSDVPRAAGNSPIGRNFRLTFLSPTT